MILRINLRVKGLTDVPAIPLQYARYLRLVYLYYL